MSNMYNPTDNENNFEEESPSSDDIYDSLVDEVEEEAVLVAQNDYTDKVSFSDELLKIPGVGKKTAEKLFDMYGVKIPSEISVDELDVINPVYRDKAREYLEIGLDKAQSGDKDSLYNSNEHKRELQANMDTYDPTQDSFKEKWNDGETSKATSDDCFTFNGEVIDIEETDFEYKDEVGTDAENMFSALRSIHGFPDYSDDDDFDPSETIETTYKDPDTGEKETIQMNIVHKRMVDSGWDIVRQGIGEAERAETMSEWSEKAAEAVTGAAIINGVREKYGQKNIHFNRFDEGLESPNGTKRLDPKPTPETCEWLSNNMESFGQNDGGIKSLLSRTRDCYNPLK